MRHEILQRTRPRTGNAGRSPRSLRNDLSARTVPFWASYRGKRSSDNSESLSGRFPCRAERRHGEAAALPACLRDLPGWLPTLSVSHRARHGSPLSVMPRSQHGPQEGVHRTDTNDLPTRRLPAPGLAPRGGRRPALRRYGSAERLPLRDDGVRRLRSIRDSSTPWQPRGLG